MVEAIVIDPAPFVIETLLPAVRFANDRVLPVELPISSCPFVALLFFNVNAPSISTSPVNKLFPLTSNLLDIFVCVVLPTNTLKFIPPFGYTKNFNSLELLTSSQWLVSVGVPQLSPAVPDFKNFPLS